MSFFNTALLLIELLINLLLGPAEGGRCSGGMEGEERYDGVGNLHGSIAELNLCVVGYFLTDESCADQNLLKRSKGTMIQVC